MEQLRVLEVIQHHPGHVLAPEQLVADDEGRDAEDAVRDRLPRLLLVKPDGTRRGGRNVDPALRADRSEERAQLVVIRNPHVDVIGYFSTKA